MMMAVAQPTAVTSAQATKEPKAISTVVIILIHLVSIWIPPMIRHF